MGRPAQHLGVAPRRIAGLFLLLTLLAVLGSCNAAGMQISGPLMLRTSAIGHYPPPNYTVNVTAEVYWYGVPADPETIVGLRWRNATAETFPLLRIAEGRYEGAFVADRYLEPPPFAWIASGNVTVTIGGRTTVEAFSIVFTVEGLAPDSTLKPTIAAGIFLNRTDGYHWGNEPGENLPLEVTVRKGGELADPDAIRMSVETRLD